MINKKIEYNDPLNTLIAIPKATLDHLLEADNAADCIALYNFYCYTAKWQKTNQPKCTTGYSAKGLKITETRVRKAKKYLEKIGLIQDLKHKDESKKVTGWYIRINYLTKQQTIENKLKNHPNDFPQGGKSHSVENEQTNALSTININALSTNNLNASQLISALIKHWNSKSNLPYCRYPSTNFPMLREVTEKLNIFKLDELTKAIDNLSELYELEEAKFRPSSLQNFIVNSIDRWIDSANPQARYKKPEEIKKTKEYYTEGWE